MATASPTSPHATADNDDGLFHLDLGDGSHRYQTPSEDLRDQGYRASNGAQIRAQGLLVDSIQEDSSAQPATWFADSQRLDKGKGVSNPVPIHAAPSMSFEDDLFHMSLPSSSRARPITLAASYNTDSNSTSIDGIDDGVSDDTLLDDRHRLDKGKGREEIPSLPPLSFTPSDLDLGLAHWPFPTPVASTSSPSSYDSVVYSFASTTSAPSSAIDSLSRTFASSSVSPSTDRPTSDGLSFTQIPLHLDGRAYSLPSMTERDLLHTPDRSSSISGESTNTSKTSTSKYTQPRPQYERFTSLPAPAFSIHKTKRRTKSFPSPLSALDLIPEKQTDHFGPIPIVSRDFFHELLPRELQLKVLAWVVVLHQNDHRRALEAGTWSVAKASSSRSRWVGRARGLRELVKLSRVSRHWQHLVFDGQLWRDLNLTSFPKKSNPLLCRMTSLTGPTVTSLNAAGLVELNPLTLKQITRNLCIPPRMHDSQTQLTVINLRGCTSIDTRSLHQLLEHSPLLEKLDVKGLAIVNNTTCELLARSCPNLQHLDMSRCINIDSSGIKRMADYPLSLSSPRYLQLKTLKLSGLKYADNIMMSALGRAAPFLISLDLSYCRTLHNSAIDAFISCEDNASDEELGYETISLSARDLGRENDSIVYRRRKTFLRHLSLSSCPMLTDMACSNLTHCVPALELLELAGIGDALGDDGLIRLLTTTPNIKRLDLEEASEITDSVLATLTPLADEGSSQAAVPGHALEQLNISYATNISEEALMSLLRNCKKLKVLEADNTHIGTPVLREFIHLCRKRKAKDARVMAVDCRGISEGFVREMSPLTRPRLGWRAYDSRKLRYMDVKDGDLEDLKIGQDECDEKLVVLKTFYSWQTVDAVAAAREKRRKANSRRLGNLSNSSNNDEEYSGGKIRWWSPNGRRSGGSSPLMLGHGGQHNGESCIIM